jgi:hypothetical protein
MLRELRAEERKLPEGYSSGELDEPKNQAAAVQEELVQEAAVEEEAETPSEEAEHEKVEPEHLHSSDDETKKN